MAKHTILCVDDEQDNVDALERIFRQKYSVLKATSGAQALAILAKNPELALIITDQRMPEMTGAQFLAESLKTHPETIRILLTGYTDIQSIIEAVNRGEIYRYINKPWDPYDLASTVDRAIERFNMSQELKTKNQELQTALNELKSLDQAKSQFMILVNHELKTPLTSIISYLELLQESSPSTEQSKYLDRISQGAGRLKQIVDDVMMVVAAETKKLPVKTQSFDCNALLVNPPGAVEKLLKKKKQKVETHWIDKKIVADKTLVEQIFHRLIHNAAKFGKDASPITIDCQLTLPHRVKFSVTNEGDQIPETLLQKILQPFFIDEDVMKHSTGMGLGLTVCQSLAQAMNTRIEIENLSGGVRVSFKLPCL